MVSGSPIEPGGRGDITPRQKGKVWRCRVRFKDYDGKEHQFNVGPYARKQDVIDAAEKRWETEKRLMDEARYGASITTLDQVATEWFRHLATETKTKPGSIRSWSKTWWSTLSPAKVSLETEVKGVRREVVVGKVDINALRRKDCVEILRSLYRRRPRRRARDTDGQPMTRIVNGAEVPMWESDLPDYGSGFVLVDPDGPDEASNWVKVRGPQPRSVLMMLLTYAADEGIREDETNPLRGTKAPERRKPNPRALTDDEADRLLALAESASTRHQRSTPDVWHLLIVLRYTGARIGEALGLTWDRIHLDDEKPWVLIDQQLDEDTMTLIPTKADDVRRLVLHPVVVAMLDERRTLAEEAGEKARTRYGYRRGWLNGTDPVFATWETPRGKGRTGAPTVLRHSNARTKMRDLVRGTEFGECDFDGVPFHPHVLRHTMAAKAKRATGDTGFAADVIGDRSKAIVDKHYIPRDDGQVIIDPTALFEADDPEPPKPHLRAV